MRSLKDSLDLDIPILLGREVDSFGTETWYFKFQDGYETRISNDEGSHQPLKTVIITAIQNHNA